MIRNALELGTTWAQLPPPTSTPSSGGRHVRGRHSRNLTCQTQTPAAPGADGTAVDYAQVRQQFGRPIRSFQAVKHKGADMLVAYETARSGAYYAAWAVGAGAPDVVVAAAMAKATSTEMFRFVAAETIQVHGGIGFTWEHDLRFYLKRAKYLEFALGTPAQHRETVAAACFSA